MKNITIISLALLCLFAIGACQSADANQEVQTTVETTEAKYDSLLAQKYGADEYGMRKYVMAFLLRGPNQDLPKAEADALQAQHMSNIDRMAEEGKLSLAGPFFGDGELRGIYIFNVDSIEEAKALTNSDPAIKAGVLEMDLQEWYGSAAVMSIPEMHKRLQKTSF